MQLTRNWTDLYGSICASFEGRAGGHTWLVASPPELAASLAPSLESLNAKGLTILLVHTELNALLTALQEWNPKGVIVVADQSLSGGPAVDLPVQNKQTEDGLSYLEGGQFPAWQSAFSATEGTEGEGLTQAPNAAASAAASQGFAVQVTTPPQLTQTLSEWLRATPHGW